MPAVSTPIAITGNVFFGFGISFSFAPFHDSLHRRLFQYPENKSDEQQDKGNRDHVCDICDDECGQPFHTHSETGDDAASQFQNGKHGNDRYDHFSGKDARQIFNEPCC